MPNTLQPKWLVFWALGLVSAILALVRLGQLEITLPGQAVRFSGIHSLSWDPATATFEQTGNDPYAFFEVPAASIPLIGLDFEFAGTPPPEGGFYIYPTPAHDPMGRISDATIATGTITPLPDGYRVRFELRPSHLPRFDLPEALHTRYQLRRVVFRTPFAGSSNPTFALLVGALFATGLALVWNLAGRFFTRFWLLEALGMAAILIAKLWLARDLHLTLFPYALHDDGLFLSLGHAIASGNWLGSYTELTLSKGPVFPLFIALVQLSRIPFLTAEAGFHAVACLAVVLALRPLLRSPGLRLALLAVLVFDPHTYSSQVVAQVLRSGIQPALTLFALAGFIGLAARASGRALALLPWALLAGIAFPLFWFCREEGIWLVPSVGLIVAVSFWLAWHAPKSDRLARLSLLVLPLVLTWGAQVTLRAINHRYYGASIGVDVKDGAYPKAYAALMRITPHEFIQGVPVTRETRLRAYAVSPAFAELQPLLEGSLGHGWAQLGWEGIDHPSARKEIRGWFQWALREAARVAGHYQNAATADAYWSTVAREINAACNVGRLEAGPRRSGFVPRWDPSLWPRLFHSLAESLDVVVQFGDFNPVCARSEGNPEQIAFYSRRMHEPPALGPLPPTPRTHLAVGLYHFYAALAITAGGVALLSGLAVALHAWRARSGILRVVLLLALAGGSFALVLIVALVDATSFSAAHAIYLSPATPLLLLACFLSPVWALQVCPIRLAALPLPSIPVPARFRSPVPFLLDQSLWFAAAFLLAAGALAHARWRETASSVPAHSVAFLHLHDVQWVPDSGILTRTGGDPYGVLILPPAALPIRHITFHFKGEFTDTDGFFGAFERAANASEDYADPTTMKSGQIVRTGGAFTVSWPMQDSKVVRLDLPEQLTHPLQLEKISFETAFAWRQNPRCRLMLLSLLASGACLAVHLRRRARPPAPQI